MALSGKAHIACKRYGRCQARVRRKGQRMAHRQKSLLALMVLMLSGLSLSVPEHAACPSGFTGTAVFGIDICAGKGIAAGDLPHAAAVMTGILDFDGDGAPDNAAVVGGAGRTAGGLCCGIVRTPSQALCTAQRPREFHHRLR